MNRIDRHRQWNASGQAGTTLILALVLILLASLLSLFALNVGLFGQRTSASDVRSRLVQQTAEAGLAQGIEYFRANLTTALDPTDTTQWTPCGADEVAYPCGVVPKCASGEQTSGTDWIGSTCKNDAHGVSLARRSTMYKYIKGAGYNVNGNTDPNDAMDASSLPLDRLVGTSVGNGFNVSYGVGALLCVVRQPVTAGDPTECTGSLSDASSVKVLTLTSVARIPGEAASTTLTQSAGIYSLLNSVANAPPLVASGTIDLTGGLQLVTSPNAGGTGVPVSVWTRLAVNKTGTPNTCYLNDFIKDPKQTPSFFGTNPQIIVCDNCDCQASLSYQNSGNQQQEGIDILNIENNPPNVFATATPTPVVGTTGTGGCNDPTQTTCRANFDIKPPEFPCDMFQFIFRQQAWLDAKAAPGAAYAGCPPPGGDGSGDCFCETAEPMVAYNWTDSSNVPQSTMMRVDDLWLYTNATKIILRGANGDPTVTGTQLGTCSDLNSSANGIIWDQTGACIGSSGDIGSPDSPVILVSDGFTHITANPRIFGILFARVPMATPVTKTGQELDPSTGGPIGGAAYAFQMEGGTVYGSVVVQGAVKKGNGGGTIVSEPSVLAKLLTEPALNKFAPVPGSWSDRFAY